MTTTDPTPLAEQIAREHWVRVVRGRGHHLAWTCQCTAEGSYEWADTPAAPSYIAHIVTVTETAVIAKLEGFADAAEALARAEGHIWEDLGGQAAGLRMGVNHLRGAADV